VNGQNVLAFDAGVDWDIKKVEGMSGGDDGRALQHQAEGHRAGRGRVRWPPVLLDVGSAPTFCDPQAAIVWSQGVKSAVKTDASLKSFVGMGSGESVQVAFSGEGWVLVQPSEGQGDRAASAARTRAAAE
jgi:uncharacterized protein (AIM24 family)